MMRTLADRAKGTAFEILYAQAKPANEVAKEAANRARIKANNARNNALRKERSMAGRDSRQRPNWTI